jgi:glycosyltransferase involved in cell wall biosynthesis
MYRAMKESDGTSVAERNGGRSGRDLVNIETKCGNLSIVIITLNEAGKIGDAIRSARFADEVLIVDSGSVDGTVEVAAGLGARIVHQEWLGFGRQKQIAVALARNDWVFVLDSDERITPELQSEIRQVLAHPEASGYRVARLNHFFGKPLRRGGLYPDYSVRLFDRRLAKFTDAAVHERVVVNGASGTLRHPMIHLAYESVDQFIAKANRYSSLGGRRNLLKAVVNPIWTFFRMYILRLGFMDGKEGLTIAALYSRYTFWKYIK